jgi:hypothetical protein
MPSKQAPPAKQGGVERPEHEIVWVSCRGKKSCDGKQARVLLKQKLGMGGTVIRYVCTTCNRPFSTTL